MCKLVDDHFCFILEGSEPLAQPKISLFADESMWRLCVLGACCFLRESIASTIVQECLKTGCATIVRYVLFLFTNIKEIGLTDAQDLRWSRSLFFFVQPDQPIQVSAWTAPLRSKEETSGRIMRTVRSDGEALPPLWCFGSKKKATLKTFLETYFGNKEVWAIHHSPVATRWRFQVPAFCCKES